MAKKTTKLKSGIGKLLPRNNEYEVKQVANVRRKHIFPNTSLWM